MGVYDTIAMSVPPAGLPADEWQTKDLGCWSATYNIAADGVMTDGHDPYTPEHSFVMSRYIKGRCVDLQADVSNGRVTKIRKI